MKNGTVGRSSLQLFSFEVVRLAGQPPEFKQDQLFRFRNSLQNIQRTIQADIAAGNDDKIHDFACHPEHALHLWLSGHLSGYALDFESKETGDTIEVALNTGLADFPEIKLVILSPAAFGALGLPPRASGATRDSDGRIL